MLDPHAACTFCPQLCRHTCPVATATGREAATPARIVALLREVAAGRADPAEGARAAALCVACGACRDHCRYGVDLPALAGQARAVYAPPPAVAPLAAVEGAGALVALECDERSWALALAARTGQDVARLRTPDHLGDAILERRADAAPWLVRLRAALAGRRVVTGCSRCQAVLTAAGAACSWLDEVVPTAWSGPTHACRGGRALPGEPLAGLPAACGAHGPLARVHPALAQDVARELAARLPPAPVAVADAACRVALTAVGAAVVDAVDLLLQRADLPSPTP